MQKWLLISWLEYRINVRFAFILRILFKMKADIVVRFPVSPYSECHSLFLLGVKISSSPYKYH